jgi:hypothetical protein
VIRIYAPHPASGALVLQPKPMRAMGLLDQGESIDALIDRAIEKLPAGAKRFEFEITGQKDEVTVAVGFRSADDWTVVLAADLSKNDQVVRLTIHKDF